MKTNHLQVGGHRFFWEKLNDHRNTSLSFGAKIASLFGENPHQKRAGLRFTWALKEARLKPERLALDLGDRLTLDEALQLAKGGAK